jgi:hypothetical protein
MVLNGRGKVGHYIHIVIRKTDASLRRTVGGYRPRGASSFFPSSSHADGIGSTIQRFVSRNIRLPIGEGGDDTEPRCAGATSE